ncbi:MAG: RNA methyltransferase [Bacteroidota bacterium]
MAPRSFSDFPPLSKGTAKFIRSLRQKQHRQQASAFVVEGAKNVTQLLAAQHYTVQMLVGTPTFLAAHSTWCTNKHFPAFQTDAATLATLGTFATNNAALAVANIPTHTAAAPPTAAWGLALDDIRDPGNLGTIVRLVDWYNIPAIACSPTTVDLYNPKVLHASMGSYARVQVYYTSLSTLFKSTAWPVLGTFTSGDNLHEITMPRPSWIVVGNEARGISPAVLPYIQQRISIPRYGQAESLNAAMATAIVCDNWQRKDTAMSVSPH